MDQSSSLTTSKDSGIKDLRTVAAGAALIGLGIASSYFYSEIAKIKDEQKKMKDMLAAAILNIKPEDNRKIDNAIKAIQIIDNRLVQAQENITLLMKNIQADELEQPKRTYQRYTPKAKTPKEPSINFSAKAVNKEDLSEDVRAMME